ncbi:hypothetical protein LTR56_026396 [Elasticomyces elasticus]|nr:hypothetical protein LTR56_026396 [Elasticomyces elasticus]KAK5748167.1 hypothetical protein LTS12_021767 [Elasticomyces elasticus]
MGLVERFYDPTINGPYDESKPSHTTFTTIVESWSDDELEDNDEYIQWLFPIPECPRRQHVEAPPLDPETRDAFHTRQELRDRMYRAWKRMMAFYGWNVVTGIDNVSITPRQNFGIRAEETWLRWTDHNHLRISRIIRSMRILGLYRQAQAMLSSIIQANNAAGWKVKPAICVIWFDTAMRPTCYPSAYPREPICGWLKGAGHEDGIEACEDYELEEGKSFRCDGREDEISLEYSVYFPQRTW